MEAVLLHRSPDQAISPYKSQIRNPKKISHPFISRPCENFVPSSFQEMGILKAPPPLFSHPYPPFSPQQPPQPPLLPLPVPNPNCRAASRGISCPPTNKKINNNNNRTRDSSLTPKKSKSFNSPRKENKISTGKSSKCVIISSTTPLGPDPKHLTKDVTKVLPFISSGNIISHKCSVDTNIMSSFQAVVDDSSDKFSGSVVFAISPPPSSLPLPTFSLRPKLGCNAEAVGIDSGATDNLRRLLRLL